jgi:hypothetical protein
MSLQLGETLRRHQRYFHLAGQAGGVYIALLRGSTQSPRNYGNLTAEAVARFLEEGFRAILVIRPSRDFPSGNKMRNTLSINFDNTPSLGRTGNAAVR